MSQQSRILAGVFCSGMAAALIAMAALQLPNWLQQRKMVSESPPVEPTATPAEPTATPTEPTATPVVTPTTPVIPETTPTNTPANTPTEETNTPDNTPTNTPDVTKSNTPADNSSKIIPQTGVSSTNSNSVAGLAIVLVAALGGAAAYLFINRKKLN